MSLLWSKLSLAGAASNSTFEFTALKVCHPGCEKELGIGCEGPTVGKLELEDTGVEENEVEGPTELKLELVLTGVCWYEVEGGRAEKLELLLTGACWKEVETTEATNRL